MHGAFHLESGWITFQFNLIQLLMTYCSSFHPFNKNVNKPPLTVVIFKKIIVVITIIIIIPIRSSP